MEKIILIFLPSIVLNYIDFLFLFFFFLPIFENKYYYTNTHTQARPDPPMGSGENKIRGEDP